MLADAPSVLADTLPAAAAGVLPPSEKFAVAFPITRVSAKAVNWFQVLRCASLV